MERAAHMARSLLLKMTMRRSLILLLLAVGIGEAFYLQSRRENPAASAALSAVQIPPVRESSEHNWPKRALDRAADAKRQAAQRHDENGAN